jgi:hypothetical protein
MQVLKTTVRETFTELGIPIQVDLAVPTHRDAPKLLATMARMSKRGAQKDESGAPDIAGFYEALETKEFVDFVADTFLRFVRPIELKDERGNEIATGKQLLDVAGQPLVMAILWKLRALCLPDAAMGKASSSPSSSSTPSETSGASPATSTATADGPTVSVATEPVPTSAE